MIKFLLTAFCFVSLHLASGQSTLYLSLSHENAPLPGAYATVNPTGRVMITDEKGEAAFKSLSPGAYDLKITYLGFEPVVQKIDIRRDENLVLKIQMKEKNADLSGVVVKGKSQVEQIREAPFHVNVVDVTPLQARSLPLTGLVNQIGGIRVREEGGMGSNFNISLNGVGGKGVRIFVDDIPADLLGNSMALNNMPAGMISRIEVYKGVAPSRFGSDALGGVLNLVTRDQKLDFLDLSLSQGSWNTSSAGLHARKYSGRFFAGINGFYNHSDNDYWMDGVRIKADELGNTTTGSVRRFNDAYTSGLIRGEAGWQQLHWADELKVVVAAGKINKQWQHGLTAETPWGNTYSEENNVNTSLSWKKYGWMNGRLNASVIVGYNHAARYFSDTAARTYYWGTLGDLLPYTTKTIVGESGLFVNGRNPMVYHRNAFNRLNVTYAFHPRHQLNLTSFYSSEKITGHDERGKITYQTDPLANPQTLRKNYAGLGLESRFFNEKLVNVASVKHFYNRSNAVVFSSDRIVIVKGGYERSFSKFGYGDAIKYHLNDWLSTSASYEYAMRLPDASELFGDYITTFPNAYLKPERSHNVNLGARLHKKTRAGSWSGEITGFYRNTSDKIFLNALTFTQSSYMNLISTLSKGMEAELRYTPLEALSLYLNATWQDIRLLKGDAEGKISTRYEKARIPNIPYLFGNAGANYTLPKPFNTRGKLQVAYSLNYVHEFYLSWEVDGAKDSKVTIPGQLVHGLGLAYLFPRDRFSISLDLRNLSNAKVFDNFSVQKPGRSFYLKIRMNLTKKQ